MKRENVGEGPIDFIANNNLLQRNNGSRWITKYYDSTPHHEKSGENVIRNFESPKF